MSLEDELYSQRLNRIKEIEALGFQPYGHRFDFTQTIPQIRATYESKTAEELEPRVQVRIAGRVMTIRRMGKAGFAHLQQNGESLQIYIRKDGVPERDYGLFQLLDIGDIIGAEGYLFRTRTGELSCTSKNSTSFRKRFTRCPRNGMGSKMSRCAIASAISI